MRRTSPLVTSALAGLLSVSCPAPSLAQSTPSPEPVSQLLDRCWRLRHGEREGTAGERMASMRGVIRELELEWVLPEPDFRVDHGIRLERSADRRFYILFLAGRGEGGYSGTAQYCLCDSTGIRYWTREGDIRMAPAVSVRGTVAFLEGNLEFVDVTGATTGSRSRTYRRPHFVGPHYAYGFSSTGDRFYLAEPRFGPGDQYRGTDLHCLTTTGETEWIRPIGVLMSPRLWFSPTTGNVLVWSSLQMAHPGFVGLFDAAGHTLATDHLLRMSNEFVDEAGEQLYYFGDLDRISAVDLRTGERTTHVPARRVAQLVGEGGRRTQPYWVVFRDSTWWDEESSPALMWRAIIYADSLRLVTNAFDGKTRVFPGEIPAIHRAGVPGVTSVAKLDVQANGSIDHASFRRLGTESSGIFLEGCAQLDSAAARIPLTGHTPVELPCECVGELVIGKDGDSAFGAGECGLWYHDGRTLQWLVDTSQDHRWSVQNLKMSDDGSTVAAVIREHIRSSLFVCGRGGTVRHRGPAVRTLGYGIHLSPSGRYLQYHTTPDSVWCLDLTARVTRHLAIDWSRVVYSADGRTMLGVLDQTIQRYDMRDPMNPVLEATRTLGSVERVYHVSMSDNGELIGVSLLSMDPPGQPRRIVLLDRNLQDLVTLASRTHLDGLEFLGRYLLVGTGRSGIKPHGHGFPTEELRLYDTSIALMGSD